MLGSAGGQSEEGGLVALPGGTQDTILELNPKYGHQRDSRLQRQYFTADITPTILTSDLLHGISADIFNVNTEITF